MVPRIFCPMPFLTLNCLPPCRAYPPACSIVIAALALMHSRFSPFRDGTVQHRIINVASMNAAGDRIYD